MSRIAVDFDGTLVAKAWPGMGEWLQGAVTAMQELHTAGHYVFLYTARLSGYWPDGTERPVAQVFEDTMLVRQKLDDAGLSWMDIWTGSGKPHWDLLIDDKAMWYPGRPKSWEKLLPAILKKCGDEDSFDEVMQNAADRAGDYEGA